MSLDKIKSFVKIKGDIFRVAGARLRHFCWYHGIKHIIFFLFTCFVYRGFLFLYQSLIFIYLLLL